MATHGNTAVVDLRILFVGNYTAVLTDFWKNAGLATNLETLTIEPLDATYHAQFTASAPWDLDMAGQDAFASTFKVSCSPKAFTDLTDHYGEPH